MKYIKTSAACIFWLLIILPLLLLSAVIELILNSKLVIWVSDHLPTP